jgi:hypothetical protein
MLGFALPAPAPFPPSIWRSPPEFVQPFSHRCIVLYAGRLVRPYGSATVLNGRLDRESKLLPRAAREFACARAVAR